MSDLTDTYFAPLQVALASASRFEDFEYLNHVHPDVLCQALIDGTAALIEESAAWVSDELRALLNVSLSNYDAFSESYAAAWDEAAKAYTLKDKGRAVLVGARAGKLGAVIGSFVAPGIGTALGTAAAALFVMHEESSRARTVSDNFSEQYEIFLGRVEQHYDDIILPMLNRDFDRHHRQKWIASRDDANPVDSNPVDANPVAAWFADVALIAAFAVVLGVAHWAVAAIWFPESVTTAHESTTSAVTEEIPETHAVVTRARTRLYERPSTRAPTLRRLEPDATFTVEEAALATGTDWYPVTTEDQTQGYLRGRDLRLERTTRTLVVSEARVVVSETTREGVMVGERGYVAFLETLAPVWPYPVFVLLWLLALYGTWAESSLMRKALDTVVAFAAFHVALQAVAMLVWKFWGIP